jgi:predicted transcriptional regulator
MSSWRNGSLVKFTAGIADLDERREVSHERVVKWLASWGNPGETKPPR